MSSTAPPLTNEPQQGQQQQQQQQPQQGLPPTGLQRQLTSLNQSYQATQQAKGGFDVRQSQLSNTALPASTPSQGQVAQGSTSLDQLAKKLATSYGLAIGKDSMVDAAGNFLQTPDQIAAASGGSETLGSAAAKMNYIADAIQRQQQKGQEQKSVAALQAGIGLANKGGRGSLTQMQQGVYQGLAQLYQNQQYEAADFSYFIQKEQFDMANQLMARQEKLAKKQARGQFVTGLGMGVAGLLSGNFALAAGGFGQAGGTAGSTGWF